MSFFDDLAWKFAFRYLPDSDKFGASLTVSNAFEKLDEYNQHPGTLKAARYEGAPTYAYQYLLTSFQWVRNIITPVPSN